MFVDLELERNSYISVTFKPFKMSFAVCSVKSYFVTSKLSQN